MKVEERKWVEDRISALLEALTQGEKAILYKILYAEGFKIADCDEIIRKAPAPLNQSEASSQGKSASLQLHLSRGWPTQP